MKCSIFICLLVCCARYCEGGALKCPPGVLESSCTEDNKNIDTQGASGSGLTETQCLAGSEWESNCHYCRCSDRGIAECLRLDTCDKGLYGEPARCKPNTTFRRVCNTCVCLDNGLGLCTLKACGPDNVKDTLSDVSKSEKGSTLNSEQHVLVVPVHNFKYQIQNGGDERNLIEIKHYMLRYTTICKPREEFMRECNPCKCAADGLSYSCTRNECLDVDMNKEVEVFKNNGGVDHIERHSVCRAREDFKIGCNTCRCNALGTNYSCTNKSCPLPPDVEVLDGFKDIKPATPYTGDDGLEVIKA